MGFFEMEGPSLSTLIPEGILGKIVGVTLDKDVRDDDGYVSTEDGDLSNVIEKFDARVDESMECVSSTGGLHGTGRKKLAGSEGSDVIVQDEMQRGGSPASGVKGAIGGTGKYNNGGDTTCWNVAKKYTGRIAGTKVRRIREYRVRVLTGRFRINET